MDFLQQIPSLCSGMQVPKDFQLVDLNRPRPLLDYEFVFWGVGYVHRRRGTQSRWQTDRSPGQRRIRCKAVGRRHAVHTAELGKACAHCLLVNGSGILRERLVFAFGALSNETGGLGSSCLKSPRLRHTGWGGNDGGGPLAEENHQCIESS